MGRLLSFWLRKSILLPAGAITLFSVLFLIYSIVPVHASPTYSFSGTLTDAEGNQLSGVSVILTDQQHDTYSATTASDGSFTVIAAPNAYSLLIEGSDRQLPNSGISDFYLGQSNSDPGINLTNGSVVQNLQIPTATISYSAYNAQGYPSGGNVFGNTYVGITSLYPGDPGETNTQVSSSGNNNEDQSGTIDSIVGMQYGTDYQGNGSICVEIISNQICLTTPYTVTGDGSLDIPQVPAAPVTFSGTLSDNYGNTLANISVSLTDQYGNAVQAYTDGSGDFSLSVEPGYYALEVQGHDTSLPGGRGIQIFDLNQSTANPSINLTSGSMVQNLQLDVAKLSVTGYNFDGSLAIGGFITGDGLTGTTYLYPGDPGETRTEIDSSTQTDNNGQGALYSLVGAGYGTDWNNTGSICVEQSNNALNCLANPLTVTGDMAIGVPQFEAPAAPTGLIAPSPTLAPVLTWTAVSGASSYNIYRDGTDIGSSTINTYTDSSATPGTYTYYVTAVNSGGESSPSNTIGVVVDSAPTITSPQIDHIDARVPINFTVTTTGSPAPTITESGTIPPGISFTDNGDGTATFSGQASTTNTGYYFMTLTATNSAGSASQEFVMTVDNLDAAPTFLNANSLTESYGTPFSFTIDTTGVPVPNISRVVGDGALPAGVTLVDNNDGTATLSGTPSGNANGVYTFTIKAHNSSGDAYQVFTLTIDRAPTVANVPNETLSVGTNFSLGVGTLGYPYPAFSVTGLPAGLTLTDNGNGTATISGTPSVGSGGVYTVTVTATNGLGTNGNSATFKVDEGPVITSGSSAAATRGTAFSFQVTSTGYPAPDYALSGATLPQGLRFNAETGVFSGTPRTTDTPGTYIFTITAANSTASVTQTFTLTLN